ncbi:MAG TPA: hypothetical protein VMW56_15445 [Candidatus Margulisiibacteriota bacterium]|nr:hypothetical protein [Candidatus Margulisiibacteriota bacterium]
MKGLRFAIVALLVAVAVQTSACALLIAGAASGGAAGAAVSTQESREEHHGAMTYAGTVLANVVYFPTKALFAAGGAAVSGVSYVATLGRPEPTASIWNASVGGNYVVTPSMIEGKAPVHFVGV